jgi:4-hydroxy-3-methylbut-2-enyl diphosphate reductase
LENEGFQVVVFGHKQHPEARATVAYTRSGIIIESPEEAAALPHYQKLAAIAQTTMLTAEYEQVCQILSAKADVFEDRGRICGWTQHAQGEAVELARQVQAMVVVGGYDSSNTIQLVKVCAEICPTYHIETADELRSAWFDGVEVVGLAAGASTREYDIAAVIAWLEALRPMRVTAGVITPVPAPAGPPRYG